jgi:hypothetical protein
MMMAVGMMAAFGLLQRRQRLLGTRQVAALERLPDLAQRLGHRTIGIRRRSLAAALKLAQRRVGLLCAGKVSGIEGTHQLAEILTKRRSGA